MGRPAFDIVRKRDLGEPQPRNRRIKAIDQMSWRERRERKYKGAIRKAAAAKAYRTARMVSQREIAERCDPPVEPSTVAHWESGGFFGWNDIELKRYTRLVDRIAEGR